MDKQQNDIVGKGVPPIEDKKGRSVASDQLTITRPDGLMFPAYNGKTLSWYLGLYNSWDDEQDGYPRMRAVIRAMKVHRPAELERERREMLKASFNRIFGHNAKKVLDVIESEL